MRYMLVHEKFGIPLPISESNVFHISKEAWLLNQVPVPEGPLAEIGKRFLLPQAKQILEILRNTYGDVQLYQLHAPKLYQFRLDDIILFERKTKELKCLLRRMPPIKPVTLWNILDYMNENKSLWGDIGSMDFIEIIRDHAKKHIFRRACRNYPKLINFTLT